MPLAPSAYFGSISYHRHLAACDGIDIERFYERKDHVNRCRILGANGPLTLTVPVIHPHGKVPVKDVRIDYKEPWQHIHWVSITSAYRTSAFFEYIMDDIEPFYSKRFDFLIDLNNNILEWIQKMPGLSKPLALINDTAPKPYYQVFMQRHGFVPDLCILDLIFNMGPEAALYI